MQALISVVVPCYNVSPYLKRCLDSIQHQTYKNIEIIVINDGSTDTTLQIALQYAKFDKRFKVYSQNNSGIAAARQKGIECTHGDYITFVDSDDYVTDDYVEFLYSLLAENGFRSPMSLCSLKDIYTFNGNEHDNGNGKIECWTGKQCIESLLYNGLVDTSCYAKLTKRSLYFSDEFPGFPIGKEFEDIATTYALFKQCNSVECGFISKYYYCIRPKSITTASFNEHKLDFLPMTKQMGEDIIKCYPDLKNAVIRREVYAAFSTLNQTLGQPRAKGYQKQLVKFIKSHRKVVLKNPKTPKRDRFAYFMLSLGVPLYRVAWDFYLKVIANKR